MITIEVEEAHERQPTCHSEEALFFTTAIVD